MHDASDWSLACSIARSPRVAHRFEIVGGVWDELDAEVEDCCIWLPDRGLVVVAVGLGHASGLGECYLPASPVARAAAGYVAARMSGRFGPADAGAIEPASARDEVTRAWGAVARGRVDRIGPARALSELGRDLLAAMTDPEADDQDQVAARHAGRNVEIAALELAADRIDFAQAGALALYRARAGAVDLVAPVGTLAHQLTGQERVSLAPEWRGILTHVVGIALDGSFGCEPLTATIEVLPGDRFLLVSPGVHEVIDEEALARHLAFNRASDPAWLADTVTAAASRAEVVRSSHPTAVAFVRGGARARQAAPRE